MDREAPTGRPLRHPVRIYFEDTDALGITYHANYLRYFEQARSEAIGLDELLRLKEAGFGFVVYEAKMRFRAPSRLGDDLEVRSAVRPMSAVRLRAYQDCVLVGRAGRPCAEQLVCAGVIDLAFIDAEGTPTRLPPEVLSRFQS